MVPLLLGHRGARAFHQIPENTLASFELCLKHGCDGFEFDVRLSADGQAVICHDAMFGRMEIANNQSERLGLPALEGVLREFAGRAFLDIELKVAGLETRTLEELRRHAPQKGYVVSSFLPEALTAIHDRDPAIPLGFLCDGRDALRAWRESPAEWVIPHCKLVNAELVKQVHAAGKKMMVWTVNRAGQMREMAAWGVDAMISDETEVMVKTVRR